MTMERTGKRWQKVCVVCGVHYVQQKGKGNSPRRCPDCQITYTVHNKARAIARSKVGVEGGQSNFGHRPRGHKTRNIHKRVPL